MEGTPQKQEREPDISFEEFIGLSSSGHKRYSNFTVIFTSPLINRNKYYERFIIEGHEDLDRELTNLIKEVNRLDFDQNSGEGPLVDVMEEKLYRAYQIMHSYGASNDYLLGPNF